MIINLTRLNYLNYCVQFVIAAKLLTRLDDAELANAYGFDAEEAFYTVGCSIRLCFAIFQPFKFLLHHVDVITSDGKFAITCKCSFTLYIYVMSCLDLTCQFRFIFCYDWYTDPVKM